eukprot:gene9427-9507_t
MAHPNVFTIGAETDFLSVLVTAILQDQLNLGVNFAQDPLRLADVTIYVPTQRAARALQVAFANALPGRATFLPRILPLGGLGQDEDSFSPGANQLTAKADVMSSLDRRLILAKLILSWGAALKNAVVSISADGQALPREPNEVFVAAQNPADAWVLAGQLANLMDETLIEGVDWDKFQNLGEGSYDDYWRITLDFLKIAFEQWPHILAQKGLVEAVKRRSDLIELEIERLAQGAQRGPIIAAGSTGTNISTAKLLKAIAHAHQGAVVLPGLDQHLDAASWDLLLESPKLAGHPQAALARLLRRLDLARDDVKSLGTGTQDREIRARFASAALRPAETTADWRRDINWSEAELSQSLASLSLIEAENEREEALSIAIAIREALENPKQSVALITPERTLAQRVAAELGRWGIVAEDSGGQSLGRTAQGAFAQTLLNGVRDGGAVQLLALVSHSCCRLGLNEAQRQHLAALLELAVLRQIDLRLYANLADALREARAMALDRHSPALVKAMSPDDWLALDQLAAAYDAAITPLQKLENSPLQLWAATHKSSLIALALDESGQSSLAGAEGTALLGLLDDLTGSAHADLEFDAFEYAQFFAQISGETSVRRFSRHHPRLAILGLLEARLLNADVMILAGCDEKIWPPQSATDALLNRAMRDALGLSSPERRLGQTAHDFTQGFCQSRVIISRASKRGGEPTVASRFLQRMEALAGASFAACRLSGERYVHLARQIDRGQMPPAARPAPRPPVELRPTRLSVTKIETLRRDPYAVYAERILRLNVLNPLEPDLESREFGTKIHKILEDFVTAFPKGRLPLSAELVLHELAQEQFQLVWDNPIFRAFDRVKIENILRQFLTWEQARRENIAEIHVEIGGVWPFQLKDGTPFQLSAEADRIEYNHDGSLTLIDFKTGGLPGANEVKVGFAPQLTLEAHMARLGGFKVPKSTEIHAFYVKLGGREEVKQQAAAKDEDLGELAARHFEHLAGGNALSSTAFSQICFEICRL